MKRDLILGLLTLLATGFSTKAYADPIFFGLDNPIQTANPGDTINFYGEVFSDDFGSLNGDTYSFSAPGTLDDSGVFLNFPQFFGPGDDFDDVLFSYTLPLDIPTGTYLGSFSLYGGDGPGDNILQGSASFSVTTVNNNSAAPEPSGVALICTGLLALAGYKRKRNRS